MKKSIVKKGYGETFRQIREERNLSLKEAARNIITPQALGRFEKGETQIGLENLGRLLVSVGVTWKDFIKECREESVDYIFYDRDIVDLCDNLEKVISAQAQKGNATFFEDNPLLKTAVFDLELYSYGVETNNATLTPEVSQLFEYINNRYAWYELDWYIFSHTINLFQTEALVFRTMELFKRLECERSSLDSIATSLNILTHILKNLRQREEYAVGEYIIRKLDDFYIRFGADLFLHHYLAYSFQKSYILLKQGNPDGVSFTEKLYKDLVYLEHMSFIPVNYCKNKDKLVAEALRINNTGLHLNFSTALSPVDSPAQ